MTTNRAPEKGSSCYAAPALGKGLDVLEMLAGEKAALPFAEIAARLERSKSELYRVLLTLEARGYVSRVGPEGFELSNRLFTLGIEQPRYRLLGEAAMPLMRALASDIGQSCHLTVLSGDQVVVIHRVEAEAEFGFSVRVGYCKPAAEMTSGLLLLGLQGAHLAKADASKILEADVMVRPSVNVLGVTDIAAPILRMGAPVAAVVVPFVHRLPEKLTLENAVDAVRRLAIAISTQLDHPL